MTPKRNIFLIALFLIMMTRPCAALSLSVLKDATLADFTRDINLDPDGIADDIEDTNALLASRGRFFDEFNNYNVDSHAMMTFDVGAYQGKLLETAMLSFYGTRVDHGGAVGEAISGEFYSLAGDGMVTLDDFSGPAEFIGSRQFVAGDEFALTGYEIDVRDSLQTLLSGSAPFVEYRVESESPTVYINAGEVAAGSVFSVDTRWPGPQLNLTFQRATVPEPSSMVLMALGAGGLFVRRKARRRRHGARLS